MLRSTVSLDFDDDFVLSEITREFDTPFVVTRETVQGNGSITFTAKVSSDRDQIIARLEESDAVTQVGPIGESMLLVQKHSCGATPIIRAHNGILYGLNYVYGTERVFDIVTFEREDIRAIVDQFGELGTAQLERIVQIPNQPACLTKRQYEVVRTAFEAGYYDWPRETDAEEIAADLEITHPTFLEHLRKAEQKLIQASLPSQGIESAEEDVPSTITTETESSETDRHTPVPGPKSP